MCPYRQAGLAELAPWVTAKPRLCLLASKILGPGEEEKVASFLRSPWGPRGPWASGVGKVSAFAMFVALRALFILLLVHSFTHLSREVSWHRGHSQQGPHCGATEALCFPGDLQRCLEVSLVVCLRWGLLLLSSRANLACC